jgi:SNF2 family DNA or RNA helicase
MTTKQEYSNAVYNAYNRAIQQIEPAGYQLYSHQIEGVQWMISRELSADHNTCGLLCDDPGLGKTIQTLSLIAANNKGGRNLIICPVSLLEQWRDAARAIFPDAKIRLCHGRSGSFASKKEIEDYDHFIVIASYSKLFNSNQGEFEHTTLHSVEWERVICDEVHTIRNRNSKVWKGCFDIKAKFRWGLSGTPLQNKLNDLKSLFAYLHISDFQIRDDIDTLKETYIMRRNRHILPDAYKGLEINIEDLDFADEREKTFYHNLKSEIRKDFIRLSNEMEDFNIMSQVFELLLRLRQGTIHPNLVYSGLLRKLAKTEDYPERASHMAALTKKIKYWGRMPSTKISKLLELFDKHTEKDKSLIISHYSEEADLIHKFLSKKFPDMRIAIFDGSLPVEKRNEMIMKARNGEIDCLIVQILCGGVGLNLQMFNKVYITTPDWNPCNEIQAIARCHRIGQTQDVEVVKLIIREEGNKPTIDERILTIQNNKREIMAQYLNDPSLEFNESFKGTTSINTLSLKDFAFLLK